MVHGRGRRRPSRRVGGARPDKPTKAKLVMRRQQAVAVGDEHSSACSTRPTYTLTQSVDRRATPTAAEAQGGSSSTAAPTADVSTRPVLRRFRGPRATSRRAITRLLDWMQPDRTKTQNERACAAARAVRVGRQPAARGLQGLPHQLDRQVHRCSAWTARPSRRRSTSRSTARRRRAGRPTRHRMPRTAGGATRSIEGDTLQSVAFARARQADLLARDRRAQRDRRPAAHRARARSLLMPDVADAAQRA